MNAFTALRRSFRFFFNDSAPGVHWVALPALVLLGACAQIGDISEAQPKPPVECTTMDDCAPWAGSCRKATACNDGKCEFENFPNHQPAATQTIGNCATSVCDGNGGILLEPAPTDIQDDNNPCTKDTCLGTSARHEALNDVACYTGPAETRNVGACKDGIVQCTMGMPTSACIGSVVPTAETCATEIDDDCDGAANEGGVACACVPSSVAPCYNGSANTVGVGSCHAGSQTCLPNGTGYGPCTGDLLPTLETCDAASVDEDCDSLSNEEGENCQCGDGIMQSELGEACDDGNDTLTDTCVNCKLPFCGDGHIQIAADEDCDDGNADATDECTTSCLLPRCGDGFVQPAASEGCDDNNTDNGDDCSASCQPPVVSLAAGLAHTCAAFADGRVKCWGGNDLGQLGLGDIKPRGDKPEQLGYQLKVVDLDGSAVSLAAGSAHTCALFDTGQVKCWGANQFGQLGINDTKNRGDQASEMGKDLPFVKLGEMALAITVGSVHSCARLVSGSVKCWGYGYFGQLGRGSRNNFGDQPNEVIDNASTIDLGVGRTAAVISAGQYHTCALLDDGSIKCWGSNEFGQLGQGDAADRGDEIGEMGNALPAIALGSGIKASLVASGGGHVCATLEDGTMKCWGAGHFGQLGIGDDNNQGDDPGEMAMLPAVAFGVQEKVVALSLGGTHSCVRLEYGLLRCFGRGNHGQLGQGTPNWIGNTPGDIAKLIPIDLDTDDVPVAFVTGTDHTCATLTEGRVKCWGRNDHGQLGLGDVEARGDEKNEMGTLLPAVELW